jgi:hypothetical protein
MDLFEYQAQQAASDDRPLAERLRPQTLAEFYGQSKVVAEGTLLRQAIENDRIFSMILWGPPGCGKTTLARIIARETEAHFVHFSAVLSGVKEIRAVIKEAQEQRRLHRNRTVALTLSDGGAARGGLNPERTLRTRQFFDRLEPCVRRLAWLNPLPPERWLGTSAEEISEFVEMFPLDRDGVKAALRGVNSRWRD